MTLSDIASLGSLVGGIAVLISLVYLSMQVKQAERNQQASIRQGRVARIVEINISQMDPSVADAVLKGINGADDISATQLYQFTSYCRAMLYNAEDGYYQHKEGLLNEAAFSSFTKAMTGMLSLPAMRVAWRNTRGFFDLEFVEFMDKLQSQVPVASPIDRLGKWKSDIAAEKALTAH